MEEGSDQSKRLICCFCPWGPIVDSTVASRATDQATRGTVLPGLEQDWEEEKRDETGAQREGGRHWIDMHINNSAATHITTSCY